MEKEYSTDLSTLPKKPVINEPQDNTQYQAQGQAQAQARDAYQQIVKNDNMSFIDKIKSLNNSKVFQEILIIGILYIILTSSSYFSLLTKHCSFITLIDNKLNTQGLLITAIIIGVLFVIARTFTSSS
jgi:hypothetical protein